MRFHGRILAVQVMMMQLGIGLAVATTDQFAIAKPGCSDKCGNLSIPYPFGTKEKCYLNDNFLITCDNSTPYLRKGNIQVTDISLQGQLKILSRIARDCYNENGSRLDDNFYSVLYLKEFTFSDTQNKFVAVGCDTEATVKGIKGLSSYTTGCASICEKMKDVDESCSGNGCCEISIPKGSKKIQIKLSSFDNHTNVWNFSPCSYAFVLEAKEFNFSATYMLNLNDTKELPAVLDWAISNETCGAAEKNMTCCACKGNSRCYEPDNDIGYRCICSEGFKGNPYLHDCQDIDECEDSSHECKEPSHCVNTVGSYTCPCPDGYHEDGRNGCIENQSQNKPNRRLQVIQIALGIGVSVIVLLVGSTWLYFVLKRRKLIKLKEKFFRQNGGLMLHQQLSKRDVSTEMVKIFNAVELKKATKSYDESMIIGRGGFGIVYKGILANNNMVAIKKSKVVDQSQIEQFINEVVVLSQINHRNVVRLLGCCLETEVPLLVYEYVANGTLFDHIHNESKASALSWEIRLRIAVETAGVLSYLHSAASVPIIHRNIKPTNILLDDNYTAKVSDFGISRLVPLDQIQVSTMVQGTLGYLDPEYLHTSQLTEKSDVYSFGVVLVELLTGKKAVSFDTPEGERSLVMYFVSSLKENCLLQVVENHLVTNDKNIELIKEVANLAKRCLNVKGEERPTMKEVAMELERLQMMEKQPGVKMELMNFQLKESLHGESSNNFDPNDTGSMVDGYDSINNHHVAFKVSDGR